MANMTATMNSLAVPKDSTSGLTSPLSNRLFDVDCTEDFKALSLEEDEEGEDVDSVKIYNSKDGFLFSDEDMERKASRNGADAPPNTPMLFVYKNSDDALEVPTIHLGQSLTIPFLKEDIEKPKITVKFDGDNHNDVSGSDNSSPTSSSGSSNIAVSP